MIHSRRFPHAGNLTVTALFFLFSLSATAADRVLDFSSGCKLYLLQNKAWVPTSSSALQGWELSNSMIVKDEKFTVFRAGGAIYGVNQRCVLSGGAASVPATPPARQTQRRRVSKRTSAAKSAEPSYFNAREKWSAAFLLGMNLGPSGTVSYTGAIASEEQLTLKSTLAFMLEGNYRSSEHMRWVLGLGITQVQQDTSTGNETSFFYARPEFPFRLGTNYEFYVGPTLGLYFLSQNANNDGTLIVKQQTASSILLGLALGVDHALNEQFDVGLTLQYFKPGSLKVTGTQAGESFESTLSISYFTLGGRFVIHF